MNMVGYLVNVPEGLSGEKGIYYSYILAANGIFIEASNPMLAARVPVAECEVRGLAPMKAKIALTYGSIPQHFFDLALGTFLAAPDRESYVAVTAAAGYALVTPSPTTPITRSPSLRNVAFAAATNSGTLR